MTRAWTPDEIKLLMFRRRETRTEFARKLRVTRDALQKWLAGSRKPSEPVRLQLSRLEAAYERTHRNGRAS